MGTCQVYTYTRTDENALVSFFWNSELLVIKGKLKKYREISSLRGVDELPERLA